MNHLGIRSDRVLLVITTGCILSIVFGWSTVEKVRAQETIGGESLGLQDDLPVGPRADPELRRRAVQQGFTMLAAIIIGGSLLLLLVVMWGNRARRLARNPLPNVCQPDDLWFLKQKKSLESESSSHTTSDEE